jgi:uncharacterized protein (TIGR02147 family)
MELESYREFLKNAVEAKLSAGRTSLRQLAKNAGFGSPNQVQQILLGKRHLNKETGSRLAKSLRLSESQSVYLSDLITLEHSTIEKDRSEARRRLQLSLSQFATGRFDHNTTALFEHWYSPLVWSISPLLKKSELQIERLSDFFYGQIPLRMLERSLHNLKKESFLKHDEKGNLIWNSEFLDVRKEDVAKAIKNYSRQAIVAAKGLLKKVPEKNQNTRSTTVTFEASRFNELEVMVKSFHQEVLAWANDHKNPDSAVQFSSIATLFEGDR